MSLHGQATQGDKEQNEQEQSQFKDGGNATSRAFRKILASKEVEIEYETEYLLLLRRSCLMQAMVSSPVNGRQKPASEMKLSDDVIKSCSVVQELSWPQKNVEIGSVKQSDDTVKP